jgi:nitrogen fixation/metabolism regulation signal transduction histidine kinase
MQALLRVVFLRFLGRIERRVIVAILLTAAIPLCGSLLVGRTIIDRITATAFHPEFGAHLERSLDVYADLVKAIKQSMKSEGEAIAFAPAMRAAAALPDAAARDQALAAEMARQMEAHPTLVSLAAEAEDGKVLVERRRAEPVDPARERTLTVRKALLEPAAGEDGPALNLAAVFATPSARLAEQEHAQEFVQAYRQIERDHRQEYLNDTYRVVFAVLLLVTVAVAIVAGMLVVRPVVRRIARLAAATRPVAEGDLSVRVDESGKDEVGDLGRAFNSMLGELEQSRARIEFLRRMGEWQKMARRLAHEIKNPLTPIQLAVEEVHRRYQGDDAAYRRIVQTTYEVVQEEVGSLRRLVGEFSSFARLPRAELVPTDLGEFLRDQAAHLGADAGTEHATLVFDVPAGPMPAVLDTEMLHRVLANLVQNADQALRDKGRRGRIEVRAVEDGDRFRVTIDDDGPGIAADLGDSLFDPYVTTKKDGTGLGLTIVKKVIVDHGGSIDAARSPLGGARFVIRLPRAGTAAAQAALDPGAPPSSRRD